MLRYLLGFLLMLGSVVPSFATHVVGGSLNYEHLGGSTYRITLKVYRDCGGINAPGAVTIQVRDVNGNAFTPSKNITINSFFRDTLNPYVDTCAFNPGICVEERIFTKVVNNLPAGAGGYHLYWQTCCRNGSIVNINNPLGTGSTFYTFIPDNATLLTNSSPTFKNFPPVFICQGQPLVFDHSASDKDGDSLVYRMFTPHNWNAPNFAFNPPNFGSVTWLPGFSQNQPLGGTTWNINAQTGLITAVPPSLGQYVVGVMVEEWRNGVKIGTTTRDFQYNVLNCPPPAQPGIGYIDGCSGLTIKFPNTSGAGATDFEWDFGDLSTTNDTSTAFSPTWTYPGLGTYTVRLIAQANSPCADTVYQTFTIGTLNAGFTAIPDSVCVNTPVQFTDTSNGTGTPNFWVWAFGDGGASNLPAPTHSYGTGGTYNVRMIVQTSDGCIDTVFKSVFVQPQPVANAGPDTTACSNSPLVNLTGFSSTGTGLWIAPGTFSPGNTSLGASYNPTAGELGAGQSFVVLSTTNNGFCPAGQDTVIITYVPGPSVAAGGDITVCKDTASIPISGVVGIASGGVWSTSGTGSFLPNDTLQPGNLYIPSSGDTTAGTVTLYLTTIGNGNCNANVDTLVIFFTNPPQISVAANDSICSGYPIHLVGTSTTGSGLWSTGGTGTFNPGDSLLNTQYIPSVGDAGNGTVRLIFKSLNNGGCKAQFDSLDISIIPSPTADIWADSVCMNELTSLVDSSINGPISAWNWDFAGQGNSSQQNPTFQFDTSGTHQVTLIVTATNGCVDTITETIVVHHLPVAWFGFDGLCENQNQFFYDSSSVNGSTITGWSWDFGNGSGTDSVQNPMYFYGQSGTFNVQLVARSAFGCVDTVVRPLLVHPAPVAAFEADKYHMIIGELVKFTDKSQINIVAWSWDFGDGLGTSIIQHPDYNYGSKGTFPVTLVVTDNNGCMDTVTHDFYVYMPPEVPTGFSPNGDGQNDILYVYGGPFKDFVFEIYNNWGELIFTSTSQDFGWNGMKDGVPQPVGDYVWQVRVTTVAGFEGQEELKHVKKGDVTLLR